MVGTIAEISAWFQLALMIGLLCMARLLFRQFPAVQGWKMAWIAFAVGFAGMLESRGLVILFAHDIETPGMRWAGRYVTPLQAILGLFVGMTLLTSVLRQIRSLRGLIHLPHPAGFVLDAESVILEWDAGAEELLGWAPSVAIGQTFMTLVTPTRLRYKQIPLVERYLQSGGRRGTSERYTLTVQPRGSTEEFPIEVLLTDDSQEDGTIRVKGIAKRLLPAG